MIILGCSYKKYLVRCKVIVAICMATDLPVLPHESPDNNRLFITGSARWQRPPWDLGCRGSNQKSHNSHTSECKLEGVRLGKHPSDTACPSPCVGCSSASSKDRVHVCTSVFSQTLTYRKNRLN